MGEEVQEPACRLLVLDEALSDRRDAVDRDPHVCRSPQGLHTEKTRRLGLGQLRQLMTVGRASQWQGE